MVTPCGIPCPRSSPRCCRRCSTAGTSAVRRAPSGPSSGTCRRATTRTTSDRPPAGGPGPRSRRHPARRCARCAARRARPLPASRLRPRWPRSHRDSAPPCAPCRRPSPRTGGRLRARATRPAPRRTPSPGRRLPDRRPGRCCARTVLRGSAESSPRVPTRVGTRGEDSADPRRTVRAQHLPGRRSGRRRPGEGVLRGAGRVARARRRPPVLGDGRRHGAHGGALSRSLRGHRGRRRDAGSGRARRAAHRAHQRAGCRRLLGPGPPAAGRSEVVRGVALLHLPEDGPEGARRTAEVRAVEHRRQQRGELRGHGLPEGVTMSTPQTWSMIYFMTHFRGRLQNGSLALLLVMAAPLFGQGRQAQTQTPATPATTPGGRGGRGGVAGPGPAVGGDADETPVVTHHSIQANGKTLAYTATAALMPLKDSSGETEAHIFYVAYTLDGVSDAGKRPLAFCFNGGPGSASMWVHRSE